ncbi:MAG: aconitate hydratase AcnA [Candidatus Xenobia bacterium]
MSNLDSFKSRRTMEVNGESWSYFSLAALEEGGRKVSHLPVSLRILLENLLRHEDGRKVTALDVLALVGWNAREKSEKEIAFTPARVLLQDFTGVPCVVDLAVMRDAMARMGGEPARINPLVPVDLVIDHSVQVDRFGSTASLGANAQREFERNGERYAFLRWGQKAFDGFRVVPPDTGIVHQVNLEFLASVAFRGAENMLYPDTVVGTDSHTTMINGLGVLGWGVGGIEAEAAMLGQPISMLIPEVVGFKLIGRLPAGATATDLVLTVTQMLRKKGVVGKFVEFYGPGMSALSLADRATLANMAPEYGATMGFFPVDEETLRYLRFTGREEKHVELIEAYYKAQGLMGEQACEYSDTLELDLATVQPSLAGPKRPQDRVVLPGVPQSFRAAVEQLVEPDKREAKATIHASGYSYEIGHGSVVIAAITSCTNTSNPSVLMAAGLLARNAVQRGLSVKPWVKTSLAPGSKVVTSYLAATGLMAYLEALRFHVVGYGCTTCIGNSGPLPEPVAKAVKEGNLVVASVLSGNRNFEGRINPQVKANYLASPPLVVAYALAGTMNLDLTADPLGMDPNGEPVYLRDIWPSPDEVQAAIDKGLQPEMYRQTYGNVFAGEPAWQALPTPEGERYTWEKDSTYIKAAPFFDGMAAEPPPLHNIAQARVLAVLGDSVTTDHISPAGSIAVESPAGKYLMERGVQARDFNSYGARRGNHEVMMRGTFANVRLRNALVPGVEGPWTLHLPKGEKMFIYDAAVRYAEEKVPLIVLAGAEYGSGSSRDWAAKGPALLGVQAVIARSFERIHRSNLIGMGVLPLQFEAGQDRESLELTGRETFSIDGVTEVEPGKKMTVTATAADGSTKTFTAIARIDTPNEVDYYRHGGILQYVLRTLLQPAVART